MNIPLLLVDFHWHNLNIDWNLDLHKMHNYDDKENIDFLYCCSTIELNIIANKWNRFLCIHQHMLDNH